MYALKDEATEGILEFTDDLAEAVEDARNMRGHILVVNTENDRVEFDNNPGVSYKF